MDTQRDGFKHMHLLEHVAIFGIYVKFMGPTHPNF